MTTQSKNERPYKRAKMTAKLVSVTPERAAEMLSHRDKQRKLSIHHAKRLAAAMERGEWIDGASVLVFDRDGYLIDGQHRLQAVILADVTMDFRVEMGVDPNYRYAIDTNIWPRSLPHLLQMEGVPNAIVFGTATKIIYRYLHDQSLSGGHTDLPSQMRLLGFCKQRKTRLAESVTLAVRLKPDVTRLYPVGSLAAMHYLFSHIDSEMATWFFERLADGQGLAAKHPIYKLREYLRKAQGRPHAGRVPQRMVWALTIKAWNAVYSGNEMLQLRWITAGPKAEPFPHILEEHKILEAEARHRNG